METKNGKRDKGKDVLEYRNEGYLPDAMLNFLAFLGWNPGGEKEIYTREELIKTFDIEQIQISRKRIQKTRLINKEHLKLLPKEEIEKIF